MSELSASHWTARRVARASRKAYHADGNSTAQQLGGAIGVALLGTVFFGYLNGHSFEAAIVHAAPYERSLWAGRGTAAGQLGEVTKPYRRLNNFRHTSVTSLTGWPVTWAMAVKSRSSHSNVSLSRSAVAAISRSTGPAERCIAASVSDC